MSFFDSGWIAGVTNTSALTLDGDCPIFRRSYVQKVLCSVLCSKGFLFKYVQKVLYSENVVLHVSIEYWQVFLNYCYITQIKVKYSIELGLPY